MKKIKRFFVQVIGVTIWIFAGKTKFYERVSKKLNNVYIENL